MLVTGEQRQQEDVIILSILFIVPIVAVLPVLVVENIVVIVKNTIAHVVIQITIVAAVTIIIGMAQRMIGVQHN